MNFWTVEADATYHLPNWMNFWKVPNIFNCRTLRRLLSRMRRSRRRPGSIREKRKPSAWYYDFSLTASLVRFSIVEADATYQVKVEGEEEIALIESAVVEDEDPLTVAFR